MDDFEGVFEKKISRFIWAKCHIKLNLAIYIDLADSRLEGNLPHFLRRIGILNYIACETDEIYQNCSLM